MYHDNKALVGEHPFGHKGQLICLGIFLFVWLMDSFIVKYSIFLVRIIPAYIRIPLGLVAIITAIYLTVESIRIMFMRKGDKPVVVDYGVYKYVRHPMYLGTLLFYFGLLFMTMSISSLIVWFGTFGFYQYLAQYEENLLLNDLGEDYRVYMKRVGMWLPVLGKAETKN